VRVWLWQSASPVRVASRECPGQCARRALRLPHAGRAPR
jgi:hypothetical protein